MKKKFKKHPMIPIFMVVIFGFIGFSLPFPIFAPMFLSTQDPLLPQGMSFEIRTLLLGVILAAYPFGQFLGAPFLGQLSDRYGRKPILILSLFGTLIAYIISAFAIYYHTVWILGFSRLLCGYSEGNYSIAQAAVTDFSEGHSRTKNFGLINMAAGLGFVIGPIIGGKLSKSETDWFSNALPFWFSALLSLITIWLVFWQYEETHSNPCKTKALHPFGGLINIRKSFNHTHLRTLYLINLVFYFGLYLFFQFYPAYLVGVYSFNASSIANISALLAVFLVVGQLAIVNPVTKILHPRNACIYGILPLGVLVVIAAFQISILSLYITLALIGLVTALGITNLQVLVSNVTPRDKFGEIMGVAYSIRVFTEMLTCLLGGVFAGFLLGLPILIGGACILLACLILVRGTKKETAYL